MVYKERIVEYLSNYKVRKMLAHVLNQIGQNFCSLVGPLILSSYLGTTFLCTYNFKGVLNYNKWITLCITVNIMKTCSKFKYIYILISRLFINILMIEFLIQLPLKVISTN